MNERVGPKPERLFRYLGRKNLEYIIGPDIYDVKLGHARSYLIPLPESQKIFALIRRGTYWRYGVIERTYPVVPGPKPLNTRFKLTESTDVPKALAERSDYYSDLVEIGREGSRTRGRDILKHVQEALVSENKK